MKKNPDLKVGNIDQLRHRYYQIRAANIDNSRLNRS